MSISLRSTNIRPFVARSVATSVALCSILHASTIHAQKLQNGGSFLDSSGKTNTWSITPSHVLVWNGSPFIPAGGWFQSYFLSQGQTDENWKRDISSLEAIKAKGVKDLILDPIVSLADLPVEAVQKLVNYLDAQGFRYGVGFGKGVSTPLSGTVVKPTNYRIEDVRDGIDLTWNVSRADSGYYIVVDGSNANAIQSEGTTRVKDNSASITARTPLANGAVAILYPHKTLDFAREGTLPDLWTGFDTYRDKLMGLIGKLKFGSGLRFFIDPLVRPLNLASELDYLVPDSPAFRLEFEAFLMQRYSSIEDLMTAWGVVERTIPDFKVAARLIPLSVQGRGTPYLLDPTTGKRIEKQSTDKFWTDMRDCRNESTVYFMNSVSDLLKREIANVPVVFSRTQQHSIFTNTSRTGGFDGLGMVAYGRGTAILSGGADSVYSQVDESPRPLWCFVAETMDSNSALKPNFGYASKESMNYDLDWLRGVGAKGVFINSLQAIPEETYKNFQIAKSPDQLTWLKEYGDKSDRVATRDSRPTTLPYPEKAAGIVKGGPIGNTGIWWMPSLANGERLKLGSSYAGYTIEQPGGDMLVLWSLTGPRLTHLPVHQPKLFTATTVEGVPIPFKEDVKRHTVAITIGENPVILRHFDKDFAPTEAVEDAVLQLKTLVAQGEKDKTIPIDGKYDYTVAADSLKRGDNAMAMLKAIGGLERMIYYSQPFSWMEAEFPESQTMSEIMLSGAASSGGYLTLNTEAKPGRSGYGATYKFNVPVDGPYNIWAAISPAGPNISPFVWIVDQGRVHNGSDAYDAKSYYMSNLFGWYNLGRENLTRGTHTLTIRVTDYAAATKKYRFDADIFLVTRNEFVPNGIIPPKLEINKDAKISDEREEKTNDKKKKPQ